MHLVGLTARYGYPLPVMFSIRTGSSAASTVRRACARLAPRSRRRRDGEDRGTTRADGAQAELVHRLHPCADFLVREAYASRERLIVEGGARRPADRAVLNRRPDLAGGAILKVPFVDVINTMLDASLPLTVAEFEEWGNPPIASSSRSFARTARTATSARKPIPRCS
jgi:oligopeptidase B